MIAIRSLTLVDAKSYMALAFIVFSAIPSVYIAPALLACCLAINLMEEALRPGNTDRPPFQLPVVILFIYLVASGLSSGLSLLDLFSFDAIRYDSNVFYSFLPLLILSRNSINLPAIDQAVRISGVAGGMLYLLSPIISFQPFESHNAAGGFFMILLSYEAARIHVDGMKGHVLPACIILLALFASDSRGSIAAVVVVSALYSLYNNRPRTCLSILICAAALSLVGLWEAYLFWREAGSPFVFDYSQFFSVADDIPALDGLGIGRPGTILHRLFFLFPMAIDSFLKSPFFGIGFTRFDDFPYQLEGISGLIMQNVTENVLHTNFHAHNSYLHILAECGVVGFFLYYKVIRAILESTHLRSREHVIIIFVIGALLLASLTEHRLTTPSQAGPTMVIVGLVWGLTRRKISSRERSAFRTAP